MLVASDSESDLPVFPLLNPASKHDTMPIYEYCKRENITPFIELNEKRSIKVKYKNGFTVAKDGIPICKEGHRMNHDGCEPA